jgi:DNA polymerase-1
MDRILLVDGNSLLHRAYHALPKTLTSPDGTITNAVFGFTRMLFKLIKDLEPTHLVVAFDRPEPTFRHEEYTAYKEHRPEVDDELKEQIPLTHNVLEGFGVPVYEVAGYEADDVIGTIAASVAGSEIINDKIRSPKDIEIVIVSGDRDLLQLVGGPVRAYMPKKGLSDPTVYDREKVEEAYGFVPEKIVDYKALKGDSSDNIPGVKGIGKKTATALLQQYDSLEDIFQNLSDIKPPVSRKLAEEAEQAALSKTLAKIVTDVPIQFDLEDAVFEIDLAEAKKVLEPLGFKSLIKELNGMVDGGDVENADGQLVLM